MNFKKVFNFFEINFELLKNNQEKKDADDEEYRVDIMVNCDKESVKATSSDLAKPASGMLILKGFKKFSFN